MSTIQQSGTNVTLSETAEGVIANYQHLIRCAEKTRDNPVSDDDCRQREQGYIACFQAYIDDIRTGRIVIRGE